MSEPPPPADLTATAPDPGRWTTFQPSDALIGLGIVVLGLALTLPLTLIATEDRDQTLIGVFIQGGVFLAVPVIIAGWRTDTNPWRAAGFVPFKLGALWLVLGAFVIQVVVTVLFSLVYEPDEQDIVRELGFDEALSISAAIAIVLAVVVVTPIAEEALFRGLFFGALRNRAPFLVAAIISGVAFGAVHAPTGGLAVAVLLSCFGILLAWVYEQTGSLGPAILLHAINNAIAVLPLVL